MRASTADLVDDRAYRDLEDADTLELAALDDAPAVPIGEGTDAGEHVFADGSPVPRRLSAERRQDLDERWFGRQPPPTVPVRQPTPGGSVVCVCCTCGKRFTRTSAALRQAKSRKLYCSRPCSAAGRRREAQASQHQEATCLS